MLKLFDPSSIRLILTDTDSMMYEITDDDVEGKLSSRADAFDFSNLPVNHPLYSTANEGVMGKMKIETKGDEIVETCAMKSKCYSSSLASNHANSTLPVGHILKEMKKCKGIARQSVAQNLRHAHFRECIMKRRVFLTGWRQFRSKDHRIGTVDIRKKALTYYDDKRVICPNGIDTLPYGHKDVRGKTNGL